MDSAVYVYCSDDECAAVRPAAHWRRCDHSPGCWRLEHGTLGVVSRIRQEGGHAFWWRTEHDGDGVSPLSCSGTLDEALYAAEEAAVVYYGEAAG